MDRRVRGRPEGQIQTVFRRGHIDEPGRVVLVTIVGKDTLREVLVHQRRNRRHELRA